MSLLFRQLFVMLQENIDFSPFLVVVYTHHRHLWFASEPLRGI
jgi:hypothetical protein